MKLENVGVAMCEFDWSDEQARAEQSSRSADESEGEDSTSRPIQSVRLLFGTRLVK